MKAGRLRITRELLAKLLGLPSEAVVVAAWQDADDIAHGSVSIMVHGVGDELIEGAAVRVVSLESLCPQPDLDMGVQLV